MEETGRLARHRTVSGRLAALDDADLAALLDGATPIGSGIGGTTASLTIDGAPVFVKNVPLTDLERRPEHTGSTVNLFNLPTFYQYGVGSAGFGAWRELAAHTMTTGWVLEGRFGGFPILYHWRVLPRPPAPPDIAGVDEWVARWEGSPAVRDRLTAIRAASAHVVLFMEHFPHTVDTWLSAQVDAGEGAAEPALAMVDRELRAGVAFMGSQGMLHFDAHFHNLLTDGQRVYFADFGLALCPGFDLSAAETAFVREHANYDRCYTATHLTRWLATRLLGVPWAKGLECIQDLPPYAARIAAPYAPVAAVMEEFFDALFNTSKLTPYPAELLDAAAMIGASPK